MAIEFFGPENGIDTKDYLLLIDGDTAVSRPEKLVGHTLTNPNIDLSDALTVTRVKLSRGRIKTITLTKRAPEERGRQYTLGFPVGALWTPAMQLALRPGCRKTFYMKYLCPEDRRYNHIDIMPDALLDPVQPEGDLITVDDESTIAYTSTLRISEQVRLWQLGFSPIYDSTAAYHDIAFATADCPTCADVPGLGMFAVGGDGVAVPEVRITDDRFESSTTSATGAAATDIATAVYSDGGLVLVGTSDVANPTAAATGNMAVSTDGGTTFALDTVILLPVHAITRLGDTLIAVGGAAAGPAKVWFSQDEGATWTASTSAALPAADALIDVSADPETGRVYAVGESGTLLLIEVAGSSLVITDLSANLPGAPGVLWAVKVLAKDQVAVGGAAGYFAESLDGWVSGTQKSIGAGVSTIKAIAGTKYRTLAGAGTALYERSAASNYDFETVTLENGLTVTGDYTAIREGVDGDFNQFVAVTDDGEVVFGKAFYPGA